MPVLGSRGDQLHNTAEALRRLRAIGSVAWQSAAPDIDHCFLFDMFDKAAKWKDGLVVTDRQLDRVRRVYQGLVERGLLPKEPTP